MLWNFPLTFPSWILYFLAGCLALAVLFVLVALLRRRRKKREEKLKALQPRLQLGVVHKIGARESQQDSYAVTDLKGGLPTSPAGFMAVVADGMGGLSHGDAISILATLSFIESFKEERHSANPEHLLIEYLSVANDKVNQFIRQNQIDQAGTTLVAAIIEKDLLHFISVGDSRICLYRDGGLIQLNREHSYGAQLDRLSVQSGGEFGKARSDLYRNAITSYLGMGTLGQIDKPARPIRLRRGDKILLASDGIFSALNEADLEPILAGYAEQAAYTLEEVIEAKAHPKQDNYTAVLIAYS